MNSYNHSVMFYDSSLVKKVMYMRTDQSWLPFHNDNLKRNQVKALWFSWNLYWLFVIIAQRGRGWANAIWPVASSSRVPGLCGQAAPVRYRAVRHWHCRHSPGRSSLPSPNSPAIYAFVLSFMFLTSYRYWSHTSRYSNTYIVPYSATSTISCWRFLVS